MIDYTLDENNYASFDEIIDRYYDDVIIWIAGSSKPDANYSSYYLLLQYKEHREFAFKSIAGATANQATLIGIRIAIERLKRPATICIVDTTLLGFAKAMKRKGVNADYAIAAIDIAQAKQCKLIEVCWKNPNLKLKDYICRYDYKGIASNAEQIHLEKPHLIYSDEIYNKCLCDVISLLNQNQVEQEIIDQVAQLSKTNGCTQIKDVP